MSNFMKIRPVARALFHTDGQTDVIVFLISNFRRVLYVVCFLLGNSPASEFYTPTFRNTLSSSPTLSRMDTTNILKFSSLFTYLPVKMEQTECSETSAYKIQTLGNYPEEKNMPTFRSILSVPSS
jgi:hypothetical protein